MTKPRPESPSPRRGPITLAFHWLNAYPGVCLAVYAVIAFVGTHWPSFGEKIIRDEPIVRPDKIFHFGGFLVYAVVLANVLGRRFSFAVTVTLCVVGLGVYGVFDELTQPFFNRTADVNDWAANMAGVAVGLIVYRVLRNNRLAPANQ
ncbi:MAG: VanZ family protein [Planctomycetota bacterium]